MGYRMYKLNKIGNLFSIRATLPIIAVYGIIAIIYGIKDFRIVCRELESAFPQAEHKGIKY